ncbi:MAG: methylenetetrahydrofolate dehydrogenase (NADP+) / methenyltetrahydrofolate cyclohydrolase [Parcubacteria group bacterium Gr01-1014_38]|nr:MAG: methylenetetrahydrofolate dehydrogenase (NADP+) / methenyltetrahydrofolate cyclohydrolase [Parcubacteria group bacterium Gr01-1014_38]
MSARLLDGRQVARALHAELAPRVDGLVRRGVIPTLALLVVGTDPVIHVFVKNKEYAARRLAIRTIVEQRGAATSDDELRDLLTAWSTAPDIHGIVLQLPLPAGHAEADLLAHIAPLKDVDCLHPENLGLLALGVPRFPPPTPAGIHQLLLRSGITIAGRHVVVVGRGRLVGRPLALLLLQKRPDANATVTVCHRGTRDLASLTRSADVLVAATGMPRGITAAHVRPGAIVVDAGAHHTAEGWHGDVDEVSVRPIAGALTPVPGGVGPMTVCLLLENVVQAAEQAEAGAPSSPLVPGANRPVRETSSTNTPPITLRAPRD